MAYDKFGRNVGSIAGGAAGTALLGPGLGTAIGTAGGRMLGGALGGLFGDKNKETPMQGKQRELIDQLLSSLKGNGPYSDLYNMDEAAYQKSFVNPMKQQFESQIAPQIQQSFIASGQQRGSGMEGNLTRAGVNMDQILNQNYAQMQQQANSNKMGAMNNILNQGAGQQAPISNTQAIMGGLSGYLSSPGFGNDIGDIVGAYNREGFENGNRKPNELNDYTAPLGNKNQVYNPYTGTQR